MLSKYPLRSASTTSRMPRVQQSVDCLHRVQRTALRPVGVLLRLQVGLEDRFQHQHRRHLHHAIPDRRDPQRPLLAVRLGDLHPPDRLRTIRLRSCSSSASSPSHRSTPVRLDVLERLAVHPGRSAVGSAAVRRRSQHVLAVHLVVQRVEAVARAIPSLWHATPSAASEPLSELLGSSPISWSFARF